MSKKWFAFCFETEVNIKTCWYDTDQSSFSLFQDILVYQNNKHYMNWRRASKLVPKYERQTLIWNKLTEKTVVTAPAFSFKQTHISYAHFLTKHILEIFLTNKAFLLSIKHILECRTDNQIKRPSNDTNRW